MYFDFKQEELGAIKKFQENCTYHGLQLVVSKRSLEVLKLVVEGGEVDITARSEFTLIRRGLIRNTPDGDLIVTELGLLVVALAEAGGLLSIKATSKAKNKGK